MTTRKIRMVSGGVHGVQGHGVQGLGFRRGQGSQEVYAVPCLGLPFPRPSAHPSEWNYLTSGSPHPWLEYEIKECEILSAVYAGIDIYTYIQSPDSATGIHVAARTKLSPSSAQAQPTH